VTASFGASLPLKLQLKKLTAATAAAAGGLL